MAVSTGRAKAFKVTGRWVAEGKNQFQTLFYASKYSQGIELMRGVESWLGYLAQVHVGDRIALCKAVRDYLNDRGTVKWAFRTSFHCDLDGALTLCPVLSTPSDSWDEDPGAVDLLLVVPPSTTMKSHSAKYNHILFNHLSEQDHEHLTDILSGAEGSLMEASTWKKLVEDAEERDRPLLSLACFAALEQIHYRAFKKRFTPPAIVTTYLKEMTKI